MTRPKPTRIAGYAALFDIADSANDTIVKGAFARTLANRTEPLPLYWQHNPDQQIGTVELAQEDTRGLRVIARIDNPESRATSELLARRTSGLSFGYPRAGCSRTSTCSKSASSPIPCNPARECICWFSLTRRQSRPGP